MSTWKEKENGDVDSYKLDWGFGAEIRVGSTVYRGQDKTPVPYVVTRLTFERGFGVRITTDRWSDCGLFLADSVESWRRERVSYLKWAYERDRERLGEVDKEIERLNAEIKANT